MIGEQPRVVRNEHTIAGGLQRATKLVRETGFSLDIYRSRA